MIMDNITQFIPHLLKSYLELIFFYPEIWTSTSEPIQYAIIGKMKELIEDFPEADFIDALMNNIEVLAVKGNIKHIQYVTDLCSLLAKKNLTGRMLSNIASYMNIYYIRQGIHYPIKLYYILRIVLNIFVDGML